MLRAVLFDLDGTLIDSEKIYHRIEMEIASELGYDFFRPQDALDMRSLYRAASIELMAGRYGDAFDYDKYHDLMTTRFMAEASRCGIELKPGIDEVLGYLKDRGLIAAVVTATALERATKVMSDVGLAGRFDDVISAHEVKKGKPNPDPYLYACDKLGITPEEALCIEDSPNGVSFPHSLRQAPMLCASTLPTDSPYGSRRLSSGSRATIPMLSSVQVT